MLAFAGVKGQAPCMGVGAPPTGYQQSVLLCPFRKCKPTVLEQAGRRNRERWSGSLAAENRRGGPEALSSPGAQGTRNSRKCHLEPAADLTPKTLMWLEACSGMVRHVYGASQLRGVLWAATLSTTQSHVGTSTSPALGVNH